MKIHVAWAAQNQPKGYTPIRKGLVYYSVENSKAKLKSGGNRNEDPVPLETQFISGWSQATHPGRLGL